MAGHVALVGVTLGLVGEIPVHAVVRTAVNQQLHSRGSAARGHAELPVHDFPGRRNRHWQVGLHATHGGGGGSRRHGDSTDQQAEAGEQRASQRWQQAHEGPSKIRKHRKVQTINGQ